MPTPDMGTTLTAYNTPLGSCPGSDPGAGTANGSITASQPLGPLGAGKQPASSRVQSPERHGPRSHVAFKRTVLSQHGKWDLTLTTLLFQKTVSTQEIWGNLPSKIFNTSTEPLKEYN